MLQTNSFNFFKVGPQSFGGQVVLYKGATTFCIALVGREMRIEGLSTTCTSLKLKDIGIPNSKKGCKFKIGKLSKFTHDELILNYIWPQNAKSSHDKIKYFLVCILLRKFEKAWQKIVTSGSTIGCIFLMPPLCNKNWKNKFVFWEDHGNGNIYLFYSYAFDKLEPKHDWQHDITLLYFSLKLKVHVQSI